MGFSKTILKQQFLAQGGRCALCGELLDFDARQFRQQGAWHGHHVNGNRQCNVQGNCAVICTRPCHRNAHLGNFSGPYLKSPAAFSMYGWTADQLAARKPRRNPVWLPGVWVWSFLLRRWIWMPADRRAA